ncbi:MAG: class I SAM-dependent methyltransferase [Hyphomicrobiales bacterium]
MVNVHIHQFAGAAPVDAHAMEQFQKQWASYQKLVDNDYVSHREVGDLLGRALNEDFAEPFAILDIACGDASLMKRVLPKTKVAHYHGIDLAKPALELAARNLEGLGFAVDLDQRDFVAAMNDRPEPADVSWCSLSIHHLVVDDKIELLKAIRAATKKFVMIYEPTRLEGEDRAAYLDRFCAVNRPLWKELTPEEWDQIEHHVRSCDLPETHSGWIDVGQKAGFSSAREVYVDPTDMYCLYRYDV